MNQKSHLKKNTSNDNENQTLKRELIKKQNNWKLKINPLQNIKSKLISDHNKIHHKNISEINKEKKNTEFLDKISGSKLDNSILLFEDFINVFN